MAIIVKNYPLKKKVFRELNKLDNLAIKEYSKGNMLKGKVYEKRSDRIYAKNYYKIFKIVK